MRRAVVLATAVGGACAVAISLYVCCYALIPASVMLVPTLVCDMVIVLAGRCVPSRSA